VRPCGLALPAAEGVAGVFEAEHDNRKDQYKREHQPAGALQQQLAQTLLAQARYARRKRCGAGISDNACQLAAIVTNAAIALQTMRRTVGCSIRKGEKDDGGPCALRQTTQLSLASMSLRLSLLLGIAFLG
jgi:hypothetical protein